MRSFILLIYLLAELCFYSVAQSTDIVKTEGIHSAFHQAHIGRIFFTSKSITTDSFAAADTLQHYQLTNKSNLFFIAFMGNSATNYLHRLSPNMPADSMVKIGNYQFALLVDGRLIYKSNLLPGAPYAKLQHEATVINKPFINNDNSNGIWSESFWNRFMHNGGDSILTEGAHTLTMEIRPYVKLSDALVGDLIATGSIQITVARKPVIHTADIQLNTPQPYSGFQPSKANFDSQKIKELKGNIEEAVFKKISSVVVIKNGELLIEEYFNGASRNSLHDPRSVGKSLASTIMGLAINERYIFSETQPLKSFYDLHFYQHYSLKKEQVTIKDLLTMSAAFDGNDEDNLSPGNEENMYPTDDWVKFALDLPTRPDSIKKEWHYFTAGVVLLGDILQKILPGGLEKYADEKLFKPLGITNYQWQYTPQKVPNTAGGIQMSALDFAKYGQLYKNGGKWNGRQLIPAEWVKKTLTRQLPITGRDNEYYGYLFWNKTFTVNNRSHEAFYCAGNGGNYILIFKNQPLVIVITSKAYGQQYAHPQVQRMLTDFILAAVIDK